MKLYNLVRDYAAESDGWNDMAIEEMEYLAAVLRAHRVESVDDLNTRLARDGLEQYVKATS